MKKYEAPVTEIVEIEAADVITTSGTGSNPATGRPGTTWNDWTTGADGNPTRPSQQ